MQVPPLLPRSLPQQQFHLLHRPVLFTNANVLSQFPPEILSAGSKEATGEAISPARSVRRRAVSRPVLRFRRPCPVALYQPSSDVKAVPDIDSPDRPISRNCGPEVAGCPLRRRHPPPPVRRQIRRRPLAAAGYGEIYFVLTCSSQLLARPWPSRNGKAVSTNCGARPIS